MTLEHILINLKRDLIRTFAVVDEWFDKEHPLHCYKPLSGGWNVSEVLEHIMLANHSLLILIEKGRDKALIKSKMTENLHEALANYTLVHPQMNDIATPGTFQWHRPDHHTPTGESNHETIRATLRDQLDRSLLTLDLLPNGEGALHTITMSVNNLGRLDVYQHLYFLSLHAQRHLVQMKTIEQEFSGSQFTVGNAR